MVHESQPLDSDDSSSAPKSSVRFIDGKYSDEQEIPRLEEYGKQVLEIANRNRLSKNFWEKYLAPFKKNFDRNSKQTIVVLGTKGTGKSRFLNLLITTETFTQKNIQPNKSRYSQHGEFPLPSGSSGGHVTIALIWIKYAKQFQLKVDGKEVPLENKDYPLSEIRE